MSSNIKKISFNRLMPYVRYIHKDQGTSREWVLPRRILYDYEIIYIIKGKMQVETKTSSYLLSDGDLHVMRPFVEHKRYIPEGEFVYYYSMHFDLFYKGQDEDFSVYDVYNKPCEQKLKEVNPIQSLMKRKVYQLSDIELPEKYHPLYPHKFLEEFNNVLEAYESKKWGYEIFLMSGLLKIIGMLVQELKLNLSSSYMNKHYEQIITQYIQYLHDHYNEKLDFDEVVRSFGFSAGHFRRLFKQLTTMTPLDYQINLRMDKAKELLKKNEHSVSEICVMVGYDDVHYFSRLFKRRENYSPKQYQEIAAMKAEKGIKNISK